MAECDECEQAPSQVPFILYTCLVGLGGLVNALTGPVVPDLEKQAHTDSAGIGAMFIFRGIGSMAGAFASGFLVDYVWNPHQVMAGLLMLKAMVEISLPFTGNLQALAFIFGFLAFCVNAIDTLAHTCLTWKYGKLMGFKMNIMSGIFGVFASTAPMLASTMQLAGFRSVFGYWVVCVADMALIIGALAIPAVINPKLAGEKLLQKQDSAELAHTVVWTEVWLCCLSMAVGCIGEASLTYWLFKYATSQLGVSGVVASAWNTAFFVAYTCTRFLGGFLVTRVGPAALLIGSSFFALLAALMMMIPGVGTTAKCVGMVLIGIGVAGLYPNALVMLRQKTFITGRAQGCTRISCGLGALMGASGPGFLLKYNVFGSSSVPATVSLSITVELLILAFWLRRPVQVME